jgi:biopolymer transport protein ExbD
MTAIATPEKATSRWRKYRTRYKLYAFPMRIVPFLNMALTLWFFWWVTSSYVLIQPGFLVTLPVAEFVSGSTYRPITVSITGENMVFFRDELVPVEALHKAFLEATKEYPDFKNVLVIEADGRVPYATVVRVMNIATSAGFKEVNLAIRPAFGETIMR